MVQVLAVDLGLPDESPVGQRALEKLSSAWAATEPAMQSMKPRNCVWNVAIKRYHLHQEEESLVVVVDCLDRRSQSVLDRIPAQIHGILQWPIPCPKVDHREVALVS